MLIQDEIIALVAIKILPSTNRSKTSRRRRGAYVALGKYSAYNLPSPENALYPCPPILRLATSISLIPIVEMRTLSPEVVACISARREVSPDARREAMLLKLWVCELVEFRLAWV